jgi:hypothetical protein
MRVVLLKTRKCCCVGINEITGIKGRASPTGGWMVFLRLLLAQVPPIQRIDGQSELSLNLVGFVHIKERLVEIVIVIFL